MRNSLIALVLLIALISCNTNKKPNIIFLLTDDQRWDALGAAGNTIIKTPNLDMIAQEGALFKNAFVTTSICACSRASILTGQYISRNGVIGFKEELSEEQFKNTYPLQLKQNGYQIGFVGKYGVGHGDLKREKAAFDYFWGQNGQPVYENKDASGDTVHYTELIHRHINEFIDQASTDQPFCLSVSFKAPHAQDGDPRQFIYNKKYSDLYKDDVIPVPEINKEKYYNQFPDFFKNRPDGKLNEARKRWELRFSTPEKYQESVKGYYRLITGVDDVVGDLRKQLKEKGLDKNTIIIYMGDNGFYLGEHGLAGKWYGHEPSIRVPLLIYDPTLKKSQRGKVYDEMVLNIDVAPTILKLAGIIKDENMQGSPFVDIYNNEAESWRDCFYYEHLYPAPIIPRSQGIRTDQYKYLYYPDSPNGYEEVYDLRKDPNEKYNLAIQSNKKHIVEALRTKFLEQQNLAQ
jgi:arylsulfatase A-like enzyme